VWKRKEKKVQLGMVRSRIHPEKRAGGYTATKEGHREGEKKKESNLFA